MAGVYTLKKIALKNHKTAFVLATIFITLVSIVDYQFFANWGRQMTLPVAVNGMIHVLSLILIMMVGRPVWRLYDEKGWIRKAWTYLYVGVILFIVVAGIAHYQLKLIPQGNLKTISFIRPFFCSPMPMFVMYILTKIYKGAV